MERVLTEKDYPIQARWVLKSAMAPLFFAVIFILFLIFLDAEKDAENYKQTVLFIFVLLASAALRAIVAFWQRANFHYSLEADFFSLQQGLLLKQQKHIPYNVIQNIFVKQDLFDRFFGLASLVVENAAEGGGVLMAEKPNKEILGLKLGGHKERRPERLGFIANRVHIPGLAKEDAEIFKGLVLAKMKECPPLDNRLGL